MWWKPRCQLGIPHMCSSRVTHPARGVSPVPQAQLLAGARTSMSCLRAQGHSWVQTSSCAPAVLAEGQPNPSTAAPQVKGPETPRAGTLPPLSSSSLPLLPSQLRADSSRPGPGTLCSAPVAPCGASGLPSGASFPIAAPSAAHVLISPKGLGRCKERGQPPSSSSQLGATTRDLPPGPGTRSFLKIFPRELPDCPPAVLLACGFLSAQHSLACGFIPPHQMSRAGALAPPSAARGQLGPGTLSRHPQPPHRVSGILSTQSRAFPFDLISIWKCHKRRDNKISDAGK